MSWLDEALDWVVDGPIGRFSDKYLEPVVGPVRRKAQADYEALNINDPDADPVLRLVKAAEMQGGSRLRNNDSDTTGVMVGSLDQPQIPKSAGPSSKGPLFSEPSSARWPNTYTRGGGPSVNSAAAESAAGQAASRAAADMAGGGGKKRLAKWGTTAALAALPFLTKMFKPDEDERAYAKAYEETYGTDMITPTLGDIPPGTEPVRGQASSAKPGKVGNLEKTPEEAMANPKKSADGDIVNDVLDASNRKNPFDLEEIIRRYGGEATSANSVVTRKKIANPEKLGLIDKGFLSVIGDKGSDETGGPSYHFYGPKGSEGGDGRPGVTEILPGEAGPGPSNWPLLKNGGQKPRGVQATPGAQAGSNDHERFYDSAAKRISQMHGISDVRKFNPYEETRRIMESQKDRYFRYIFGSSASSPDRLNPNQRKYWESQLDRLEQRIFHEMSTKYQLAAGDLKNVIGMFEKSRDKFKEGRAGGFIYDPRTGQIVNQLPDKQKEAKPLSSDQASQLDRILAGQFMDRADRNKEMMNGGKIYESLGRQDRDVYDTIRERAQRILLDSTANGKPVTVPEAIKEAMGQAGGGKQLDKQTADAIMKEVKGDKNKAREIARQRGYTF